MATRTPADSSLEVAANAAEYSPVPEHFTGNSYKESYHTGAYADTPPPAAYQLPPSNLYDDGRQRPWRERHPLLLASLTALAAAIVVGGAVGGGLGGSLGGCDKSTSNSPQQQQMQATTTVTLVTPSAASTSSGGLLLDYIAATATAIANVAFNCDTMDRSRYSTTTDQDFQISCPETYYGGDLGSTIAYNIYDCIEACSALNYWQDKGDSYCSRVAFSTDIGANHSPDPRSNCWLKSNESVNASPENDTASARLVDS